MKDGFRQTKILKMSSVVSSSHPERVIYLNLRNGILYELNPDLISELEIEVVDGSNDLTSLEKLRKESLRIMDEYIRSDNA
jgi:hypothetical protein